MANRTTITYDRGTTYTIGLTYSNANNVDGVTAMFTVKSAVDSDTSDNSAIFKQDVSLSNNTGTITINPNSISTSVAAGNYIYDCKVLDANNEIYTIVNGVFTLNVTATNRLT